MDSKQRILSLLGLALRGGNLAVGEEPAETAAEGCRARLILVASDAAAGSCRKAERFAQIGNCILLRSPFTKAELGHAAGRAAAAMAAVTDTGLAAAVGRRMAELDPAEYGAAAERLELKSKRAAERKAEQKLRDKEARRAPKKAPEPPGKAPGRQKKPVPPERGRPGKFPDRSAGRQAGRPAGGLKKTPPPGKPPERAEQPARSGKPALRRKPDSRTGGKNRPKPRANPYARSRPVKKGKGSFRKRES